MSSSTFLRSEDLEGLLDAVIRDLERLSVSDGVRGGKGATSPISTDFRTCNENISVSHLENRYDGDGENESSRKILERIPVRILHSFTDTPVTNDTMRRKLRG